MRFWISQPESPILTALTKEAVMLREGFGNG